MAHLDFMLVGLCLQQLHEFAHPINMNFFGKMNSHKCKLNFMVLQTNIALGSTNFIGIITKFNVQATNLA